jgi:hypothetical protein
MKAELILWVGLLVVLLLLFLAVLRRLSVLIARTRDLERVQRSVESINRRFAIAIGPIVDRLDEIRRRSGDPMLLARDLDPARSMLEDLAVETRKLRVPAMLAGQAAVMVHEMDRALRATELVGHGMDALLAARGHRDLEAQTSLKRGALNLRHARDAFGRAAAEVAAVRPADVARRPWKAHGAADGARVSAYFDLAERDLDPPL